MFWIPVLALVVYIIIFIRLKFINEESDKLNDPLKLSVIIAAKNEANNIPPLVEALNNQSYPKDKFEVIIIDDNSNDNTAVIAQNCISDIHNFSLLSIEEKKFEGKRGALQKGIENAKYSNIVITDADCIPQPEFLQAYSNKFSQRFDFIFGISPYHQNKSVVNKIACFENLWVHILTFAFSAIGIPYSASARSFGFSKTAFERIGGYKNTTDTLSGDDDLLLREAVKNGLKIGTISGERSFVHTNAKTSIIDLIRQKSRHTSSSFYYSFKVQILLGIWHLLNIIMLFSLFLAFISPNLILLFLFKVVLNIIATFSLMEKFGYSFNLIELFYLQFPYELLVIINFINGFFSKRKW